MKIKILNHKGHEGTRRKTKAKRWFPSCTFVPFVVESLSCPTTSNLNIAVIGGGPGGYAAAFLAADLGMSVTLIDPEVNPGRRMPLSRMHSVESAAACGQTAGGGPSGEGLGNRVRCAKD